MTGYRPWSVSRGKLTVHGDLANIQRPRVMASIEHGAVWFSLEWSDGNCDPFAAVLLDLTDTRAGNLMLRSAMRCDSWKARHHGRHRA